METYLLSLIRGFQHQGDDVSVYVNEVDWNVAREMNCKVHVLKSWWTGKIGKYLFLNKCNTLPLRQKYDLSISLTRTCCQDIGVCGGVHPETIQRIKRTALLRGLHDQFEMHFERRMFAESPCIVAHSAAVADQIVAHYQIDREKIHILYPPIDTERFFPQNKQAVEQVRTTLNIDDQRMTVLFVSCGHQCKGLQQLLLAFSHLNADRYELLVAGSKIPGSVPDNVRYIGYIQQLAPVYSAVNFTILPSDYEAFGLVVPESLQCGTPVIVSRNVGAAELLTEEEAVFLPDNRPETIMNAIMHLDDRFSVPPDFAGRHNLTVDQHVTAIKNLACRNR